MTTWTVTSGEAIDAKAFWTTLGQRATGMTVVTADSDDGPTGFLGLSAAHVTANRIDGSVEVTNTTADDIDLTFDVKAVAENGRATEIGYQRFPLKKGTVGMTLPFGETLPHGGYMVYVNVVGEVPARNVIYTQLLQTPHALQVNVEP